MLHVLLWEGLTDPRYIAARTTGFEALRDRVREFTPREAARITGLNEADIVTAARWFGQSKATLSLYCQGLNQSSSGTAKNAALINLHLATGQIGKPGAGPFSLTGQPNAMGGREVGGLANLLSAHRDMAKPEHRAEVAALWGVADVPSKPGKTAVAMFQAAADGEIRALWIACTNPAQSLPDQATVQRALQRAEFVVLQEAFVGTATARYAHLLLPASSWGEKEGTVTNSERRISRVRAAVPAPGQARADWDIACDFARRLEARLRPGQPTLFPYDGPEAIWNEHRESTRGRDLDITGLSWQALDTTGPQCWPFPAGANAGTERLYADGRFPTDDGRARFADVPFKPVAEPRDARFPFALNTGRLRDQWHGMSRTGTLARLFGHTPEPTLDLHPQDMARLRLVDGDLAQVSSRRGSLVLPARASEDQAPTQAFIAMHWGEEHLRGGVNLLASPAYCPQSKQPELKHAAVQVTRADLPWRLVALAWCDETQALALRAALRPFFEHFAFAACVPFGRERHGVLFRAAAATPAAAELVAQIAALFELEGRHALHYVDARRGQRRSLRLAGEPAADQFLQAFLLAGDTRAESWIAPLLQQQLPAQAFGRQMLLPGAVAPGAVPQRARQVCSCFDVDEPRIVKTLAACTGSEAERLAALQGALRCGTQCGSCVPELKRLIAAQPVPA